MRVGAAIGRAVSGEEVLELVGDIGAGKATLTEGIAQALEIDSQFEVQLSAISRVYDSPRGLSLAHYDFYRWEMLELSEEIRSSGF